MCEEGKPLGIKAYGSIGHLPESRVGPGDHAVPVGQAKICTVQARDKHDRIIVHEKLDGSCAAVAMICGNIVALGRAGWLASSSPYIQHTMFASWVRQHEQRFKAVLKEGERIVGEWLAQAHGTLYDLRDREPWGVFDLMRGHERATHDEFMERVDGRFWLPNCLHDGGPMSVDDAMRLHLKCHWPCDKTEGLVYRVERQGEVDFLAKWVRKDKTDGLYFPENTGEGEVWNWPIGDF